MRLVWNNAERGPGGGQRRRVTRAQKHREENEIKKQITRFRDICPHSEVIEGGFSHFKNILSRALLRSCSLLDVIGFSSYQDYGLIFMMTKTPDIPAKKIRCQFHKENKATTQI